MLLTHATVAVPDDNQAQNLIGQSAIAIENGMISWTGRSDDVPAIYRQLETLNLEGRLVTPGLIDCHTHIVHGGNRAKEFKLRLDGASYEQIANAGGGIVSTVSATREASEQELLAFALPRVDALIAEGVCTIEVKSGYGLDIPTELKMLRTARAIARSRPVTVKTTFLGAHAVPKEYLGQADEYIIEQCLPALDAAYAEGLVDAVDGFCEKIAFSPDQIERVFNHAKSLSLPVKLHAEQLSNLGGAKLASRFDALSVDHLEYCTPEDAAAMAESGSVAVILPGAFYTLRETQSPPIDAFRMSGVPMAVATDCNPGSSPMTSLLLAMNMACTLFRMTTDEVLAGTTKHAAQALGLNDVGVLAAGRRADLAIWDIDQTAELAYRIGFNPLWKRMYGGKL